MSFYIIPENTYVKKGIPDTSQIIQVLKQLQKLDNVGALIVEAKEEWHINVWHGAIKLQDILLEHQQLKTDLNVEFADNVEELVFESYSSKDLYYLSSYPGIKINSEFSSEPILVSNVSPKDDIVSDVDSGILSKLFTLSKTINVKIIDAKGIGNNRAGTILNINPAEDFGTLARKKAVGARTQSQNLQQLTSMERSEILVHIAQRLSEESKNILAANKLDLEKAEQTNLAAPLKKRLKLTPEKIQTLVNGIIAISEMKEPIGQPLIRRELSPGLILCQETAPFGVLLVIFESRPDCLPQVVSLALRSGNGLLLKGGKEAKHSNGILHQIIVNAIANASGGRVTTDIVGLFETRHEIGELLNLDDVIDLVIPRGSGALVRFIETHTRIPVLGHSEGMCHFYIDAEANLELAIRVLIDAKTDYPAACNATETLILNENFSENERVLRELINANVTLCAPLEIQKKFPSISFQSLEHYRMEYGDTVISIKLVSNINEAISHINKFGSGHTEAIMTENKSTAEFFLSQVDAACVFHNASTRMADGFRFGLGAEVGISTKKVHARGPVGVMGLETTKWKLRSTYSDGHCAGDFSSKATEEYKKNWTHQELSLEDSPVTHGTGPNVPLIPFKNGSGPGFPSQSWHAMTSFTN